MKAILKQIRNSSLPTFVTAAVLLLCSPFCHVARAQSDNSFSSEQIPTDLIRDNDVVPTDFQQDFAKRAENAFGEARESVTATLDQAEPALDEWTRSLEATTQKLLPADGSMPWVEDIQRQASTIQLPKVLGSLAIVIGGYLGAGKTTLVNHMLRNANGLKLAILVNEFGELPIDADLIEAEDDNLISLAGGCIPVGTKLTAR